MSDLLVFRFGRDLGDKRRNLKHSIKYYTVSCSKIHIKKRHISLRFSTGIPRDWRKYRGFPVIARYSWVVWQNPGIN